MFRGLSVMLLSGKLLSLNFCLAIVKLVSTSLFIFYQTRIESHRSMSIPNQALSSQSEYWLPDIISIKLQYDILFTREELRISFVINLHIMLYYKSLLPNPDNQMSDSPGGQYCQIVQAHNISNIFILFEAVDHFCQEPNL